MALHFYHDGSGGRTLDRFDHRDDHCDKVMIIVHGTDRAVCFYRCEELVARSSHCNLNKNEQKSNPLEWAVFVTC